jgi:small GTP-binding protein
VIFVTVVDDEFQHCYISTIGVDFRIKTFDRSGKTVKLQVWDTAGQERFRAITTSYYRGADGIVLCYDMTDPASVDGLADIWLREIQQHASKNPRLILVGNKSDLSLEMTEANRELVHERVENLKERLSAFGKIVAVEASAKAGRGVDKAFEELVDSMTDDANQRRIEAAAKRGGAGSRSSSGGLGVNLLNRKPSQQGLCCSLV